MKRTSAPALIREDHMRRPLGSTRLLEVTLSVQVELLEHRSMRRSCVPKHLPPAAPLFIAEMTLEVEIVATLDDATPPVSTPPLDCAVAD